MFVELKGVIKNCHKMFFSLLRLIDGKLKDAFGKKFSSPELLNKYLHHHLRVILCRLKHFVIYDVEMSRDKSPEKKLNRMLRSFLLSCILKVVFLVELFALVNPKFVIAHNNFYAHIVRLYPSI